MDDIHAADKKYRTAVARALLDEDTYVYRSVLDKAELYQFWREMGLDATLLAKIRYRAYGATIDPISLLGEEEAA